MAVSSPCLTTSLPSLSASSRLNSSFGGARVQLADNLGTLFNCRAGETSRIRAELDGAPSIETSSKKVAWRGVPTKLNTTPHSREIRQYFYKDVCQATKSAISDGKQKLRVQVTNPEMDLKAMMEAAGDTPVIIINPRAMTSTFVSALCTLPLPSSRTGWYD